MIGKIVQYFKYFMHPGVPTFSSRTVSRAGHHPNEDIVTRSQVHDVTGQRGNINSSLTLTYPEEFDIQMFVRTNLETGSTGLGDSTSVKPLFKVKRSVLESLSVDYATSGAPAFITDDGLTTPATTSLTMQFKETELMTKQSIAQGY